MRDAVARNAIYAQIIPGSQLAVITSATDNSLLGSVLIQLNDRNLRDHPMSQDELNCILCERDCQYRIITKHEYHATYHQSRQLLSFQGRGYEIHYERHILHPVLTYVTVVFTRQTGFQSGDILFRIANIDPSTIERNEVHRLLHDPSSEAILMSRDKYQRIMERRKLFRSIQQEWDFDNPCKYCFYIYLKGKLLLSKEN
jgi:hypothetical protein